MGCCGWKADAGYASFTTVTAQLSFFFFLLMQTTLLGVGLLAAAMTLAVLALPDRRRLSRLILLPALWLLPLALAGLFYEHDVKTADWLVYTALPMLAAYMSLAIWSIMSLPRARIVAVACAVFNAPFALLSAFVTATAAGGTWP